MIGFVENMSKFVSPSGEVSYIFGKDTVQKEAERLEVAYLGEIPLDQRIREGGDAGKPIVLADPTAEPSVAFIEIARKIVAAKPVGVADEAGAEKKKGLFSFLKG